MELEQGQVAHRVVEELRAYGDAARIGARKLMDGHDTRLGEEGRRGQTVTGSARSQLGAGPVSNSLTWMFESLFIDSKLCFNGLRRRVDAAGRRWPAD
jgi:hypothetical protein